MSPPVELHLVHRPHGALDVLHPAEALVEGEVVSHGVLDKTTISVNVTAKVQNVIDLNEENKKDGCHLPFFV